MRILVVSPFFVPPDTIGAKRRISNILKWLKRRGHQIDFVYTGHDNGPMGRVERLLRDNWDDYLILPFEGEYEKAAGDCYGIDDWYREGSGEELARFVAGKDYDIALINYVFHSKFCEFLPADVVTVIDTHDKLSRLDLFTDAGIEPGFYYTTEEQEQIGLARADVVLAIQPGEAEYFSRAARETDVLMHLEDKKFLDVSPAELKKVGYIGAVNKFNRHAVDALIAAILPRLETTFAGIEFHFAGRICRHIDVEHKQIVVHGFVNDPADFYGEVDVIINPTLIGTGLKIKTVEALSYGVPLVSTAIGFDGIHGGDPDYHHLAGIDDLLEALLRIKANPEAHLGRLMNLSRAIFTEYDLSLKNALERIFSDEVVARKRQGALPLLPVRHESFGDGWNDAGISADTALVYRPARRPGRRPSFAHIVNPVAIGPQSDLFLAQPVTFESMRRAREAAADVADVELFVTGYDEDKVIYPADFTDAGNLPRSMLDVGSFEVKRKLPILKDILDRLYASSDAEYFVFTNVDIGLLPNFYQYVIDRIENEGCDALVINRRTISKRWSAPDEIERIYGDPGAPHPGFDCFVFRRDAYPKFVLGEVCVGIHIVGRVLLLNLIANARNFRLVKDAHVTFHIGDDRVHNDGRLLDYVEHNLVEAIEATETLDETVGVRDKLEALGAPWLAHMTFVPTHFDFPDGRKLERPIFIHALFRTGSTYIWSKLRTKKRHKAFYEPFHEQLAMFSTQTLAEDKKRHRPSNFHNLNVDDWFFSEFEPLLTRGKRGVRNYETRFAFDDFVENGENPKQKRYVDTLMETARPKVTILQFNRSALRQAWFRREYPDVCHVYLHRDPRDQWHSYMQFYEPGKRAGFSRNDIIAAGKNRDSEVFKPLSALVPLVAIDGLDGLHRAYDTVFPLYDLEELYTVFYYIWLFGLHEGCRYSDFLVDLDRLVADARYRGHTVLHFNKAGIRIDFDDARASQHEDLRLSADTMMAIERRVAVTLADAFGDDWFDVFAERGLDTLHRTIVGLLGDQAERQQVLAEIAAGAARRQSLAEELAAVAGRLGAERPETKPVVEDASEGAERPIAPLRPTYSRKQVKEIEAALRKSGLFVAAFYLEKYPDVREAGADPLRHYIENGAFEGRDPNPYFSTGWYLKQYPDVAAAGLNPLLHYVQHGAEEGRDPGPRFCTKAYQKRIPPSVRGRVNPLLYFLQTGFMQGHEAPPVTAGKRAPTSERRRPKTRL